MSKIKVRPALRSDTEAIHAIAEQMAWRDAFEARPSDHLLETDAPCAVALEDNEIVGFCIGRHHAKAVWVIWLGVAPKHPFAHVARPLMAWLADRAPNGITEGYVAAWCVSPEEIKFFADAGSKRVDRANEVIHFHGGTYK